MTPAAIHAHDEAGMAQWVFTKQPDRGESWTVSATGMQAERRHTGQPSAAQLPVKSA